MAEEKTPTISLTHQRVTSMEMSKGEVETLMIAEVIRKAAIHGVVIELNKGVRTRAEVIWGTPVTVEITEDMTLDAER